MTPAAVVDMFMPRNLFGAFVGNQRNMLGDVLPLILFAILVGAAGLKLPKERRQRLQDGLETVSQLMTGIVHFALKLAPYRGAGADLQRRRQGRSRHPDRARASSCRLLR